MNKPSPAAGLAEIQIPCEDLPPTLAYFVDRLGFRVETIFPAEEPTTASLSGHGLRVRLAPGEGAPGIIRIALPDLPRTREEVAPNGTRVHWVLSDPPYDLAPLTPSFVLTRQGEGPAPGAGRAGMIYRDLIPDRQGGRFIASHITIPEGGPVADWVHFHKIRFQMIFCRRGWARVVYEDQGEPLIMRPGDCVLQPPRIRHQVLEASAGFEVVEIGCPALHETLADHDMDLPTSRFLPDRDFSGQHFLHHVAADAPWTDDPAIGFARRETGMAAATGGIASVHVLKPTTARAIALPAHGHEMLFGFLLEGSATLNRQGAHALGPADAFVIPPGEPWGLRDCSADLNLLQVTVG